MNFFDRLARTDTKGGIGVVLGVLFVLGLIVAMLTPVPFNEAAAWVAASLIAAWLGLATIGKGVQRATDYTYAAVKKGTVVPVPTGTTGQHATTVTPPIAAPAEHAETSDEVEPTPAADVTLEPLVSTPPELRERVNEDDIP